MVMSSLLNVPFLITKLCYMNKHGFLTLQLGNYVNIVGTSNDSMVVWSIVNPECLA
jgi:hypothetical protein